MDPWEQNSVTSQSQFTHFQSRKCLWKCHMEMAGILSGLQWVNVLCGCMATTDSNHQRCCIEMGTIMYLLLIPTKHGFLLPKHLIPSSNYDLSSTKYHFKCDATVIMQSTPDLEIIIVIISQLTLRWRHNGRDGVSNHQPHDYLLNSLFRHRSKKTSKLIKWKHFPRYWPFVRGIHRSPVNSLHKGQWRGKCFHLMTLSWIKSMQAVISWVYPTKCKNRLRLIVLWFATE